MPNPSSKKGKKKKDEQGAAKITEGEKQAKQAVENELQPPVELAMQADAVADITENEAAVDEEKIELLAFRLSNEEYALYINRIKEIIKPVEITKVPRTPPFIMGIISLRGVIVPVYDLKKRLGLIEANIPNGSGQGIFSSATRILIVNLEDESAGIIVDGVTGVVKLNKDSIEPTPPIIKGVDAEYLKGVGRSDNRLFILLDIDRVLKWDSKVQSA
jgi:purine-binding chemotaxis protein CheW